ncbi:uncharacterized protein G2W53_000839 [Senna tora]|uniref:Uncharacterized protein n=1 Tax=Senna tora TaxID=362788 RepID=A0A834XGH8_9FABA|nr:uncharacterized protein G2W53_000839 [Senna tora]
MGRVSPAGPTKPHSSPTLHPFTKTEPNPSPKPSLLSLSKASTPITHIPIP